MTTDKVYAHALRALFTLSLLFAMTTATVAQTESAPAETSAPTATTNAPRFDHDVQLYLLVASNEAGGGLPTSLQAVGRELRAVLPLTNYRLAASFFNRVRDGGDLQVSGVTDAVVKIPNAANVTTQYNFRLSDVRLLTGNQGRETIQIPRFNLGLTLPIVFAVSAAGVPQTNSQNAGISTSVNLREGVPAVIGTITTGRPDEVLVLVASIKRASVR